MKLKFKNTNINYTVQKTNNKEGLANNDSWLMVDFNVKNDDISYHSNRKSLSLSEICDARSAVRTWYDDATSTDRKITFIKNYFKLYLKNTSKQKTMILELIDLNNVKGANYSVYFEEEEILDFVDLSQNIV